MIVAAFAVGVWLGALAGIALGVALTWPARRRREGPPQHRPGVPMRGGQVLMGPQQPRPQVQDRVPLPPGMPTRGPANSPSGQAKAR